MEERQKCAVDQKSRPQVDMENLCEVFRRHFNERVEPVHPGEVDDRRYVTGAGANRFYGVGDAGCIRQVNRDRDDVFSGRTRFPVECKDAPALSRQHSDGRLSHSAGSAGHNGIRHEGFLPFK